MKIHYKAWLDLQHLIEYNQMMRINYPSNTPWLSAIQEAQYLPTLLLRQSQSAVGNSGKIAFTVITRITDKLKVFGNAYYARLYRC